MKLASIAFCLICSVANSATVVPFSRQIPIHVDLTQETSFATIEVSHKYEKQGDTSYKLIGGRFSIEPVSIVIDHVTFILITPEQFPNPPVFEQRTVTETITFDVWPSVDGTGFFQGDISYGRIRDTSREGFRFSLIGGTRDAIVGGTRLLEGPLSTSEFPFGTVARGADSAQTEVLTDGSLVAIDYTIPAFFVLPSLDKHDGVTIPQLNFSTRMAVVPEPSTWVIAILFINQVCVLRIRSRL